MNVEKSVTNFPPVKIEYLFTWSAHPTIGVLNFYILYIFFCWKNVQKISKKRSRTKFVFFFLLLLCVFGNFSFTCLVAIQTFIFTIENRRKYGAKRIGKETEREYKTNRIKIESKAYKSPWILFHFISSFARNETREMIQGKSKKNSKTKTKANLNGTQRERKKKETFFFILSEFVDRRYH